MSLWTQFPDHNGQISVRVGDKADTNFLAAVLDEFGAPDVVLDDGSHLMEDLAATFAFLYPKVSASGVYMVEDLHTAYWDDYGGRLHRPQPGRPSGGPFHPQHSGHPLL